MFGVVFMNLAGCCPRTDRRGQAIPILKPMKMFPAMLMLLPMSMLSAEAVGPWRGQWAVL